MQRYGGAGADGAHWGFVGFIGEFAKGGFQVISGRHLGSANGIPECAPEKGTLENIADLADVPADIEAAAVIKKK